MYLPIKENALLAIDPGTTSGATYWDLATQECFLVIPWQDDLLAMRRTLINQMETPFVVIEDVHSDRRMAQRDRQRFDQHIGMWRGLCAGLGCTVELVKPQVWQHPLQVPKGMDYSTRKQWLWEKAKQLMPNYDIKKKYADAYLLGDWAINQRN